MKLKTVIVEDEILGQQALLEILKNYCDDSIEVTGVSATVQQAIDTIKAQQPHLVFLDIKLGSNDQGAFDVLRALANFNFKIIFTTSSRQTDDILKALNKFGAKKYLLKPLDIDEVIEAVKLAQEELNAQLVSNQIEDIRKLLNIFSSAEGTHRLKVPVKNGFQYILSNDIIMLRSNANVTVIFLCNNGSIPSSRSLKYYEGELPTDTFLRVSKSYIINLNHVESYSRENGGTIYLANNCTSALSDKYAPGFFKAMDL